MRSTLVRLSLLVCSILSCSVTGFAQYDYLPKVGIKDFATYQQSSIDSVDLDTGNVNLHIPLIGFPQKGNKLRLNFIVRYNEPQWLSTIGTPRYNPTIEGYTVAGTWKIQASTDSRPLGVDVVRDQAVTSSAVMTNRIAPGCCGNGDPIDYSSEVDGIRDRTGATHVLEMKSGTSGGPTNVSFPAPDGSGWRPVATYGEPVSSVRDSNGVLYSSFTIHPGSASRPAWNISDNHGNTITTDVDGWHDSMGRYIPGSWTGHGSGSVNSPNGYPPLEDDPFPGVSGSDLTHCSSGAVAARIWTVPSSADSGGTQTYYFCYSQYTAHTHFNFNGRLGQVNSAVLDETSFTAYLLSQIVLPNDKSYSFQYDPDYLDLTRIDLPTGGVIQYQWGTVKWDNCSTALPMKRVVTSRSVTTGDGVSSWSYNWGNGGVCNPQPGDTIPVIVSNPDQNDEWHHQSRMEDNGKLNKYVVSYKGHASGDAYNATGTISKIVKTSSSFRQTPLFTQTQDILVSPETGPDGPIVKWLQGYSTPEAIPGPVEKTVVTLYDTATQSVVSSQETDATPVPSSGTIERWNPDNYWYPAHDTCACVNYSEVKSEQVYGFVQGSGSGPGTLLRETDTTYRFQDSGGADYENNGLIGLPSQVKVYDGTSHQVAQTDYTYDEASYSAGVIAGEQTSIKKWKDASHHDDTHTSFNSDGTWIESVDANGVKTHANSFDCSSAFPKSVTKAYGTSIAETFVYSHDCNTGKVTSYVDANSKTTTYTYADPLSRVKTVDYPDGGHTEISYVDGANSSTTIEVDTGGVQGKMSQTVKYDLVGRTSKVQQKAGNDVIIDTHYDVMGRVYTTSNPYTSTQGSSSVVTTNIYDELGRPTQKANQDGTSQTFSYSGNVVTTKDELSNAWKRTSDALGELTQVVEPNGATTNYTYTARGDLATVNQAGLSGETARTRSFDYDWLSRLKQSFNPESGWICYGNTSGGAPNGANCTADYDGNGNLNHKTDARGVVTSYNYDFLNRLSGKSYSDGITPSEYYAYDTAPGWMPDLQNVVGRLAYYGNSSGGASAATFSYDAMGRVRRKWQQTPSSAPGGYFASADYDLAGNMIALTYPDGRRVTQSFDNAGRMSGVSYDSWGNTSVGTQYLSSGTYDPAGHLTGGDIGYSLHYTGSYDKRLRLASYGYLDNAPSYLLAKGLSWQANGNLDSEINWISGIKRQYGYDSLNRLTSAVDVVNSSTSTGAPISYPASGSPSTSSTNVLPNANTLLASNWSPTSVSITDNGTAGPDGSMTASVVVSTGTNSSIAGHLSSLASTYIGTAMIGSVWLCSPGGNKTINIYLVNNFAWGYQPIYKQITVTPTWQQFSITSTVPNDITDLQFQIGGGYTYASGEIDVWGARLEPSASVGSTVTNFLQYSQRLNGFPWYPNQLSIADNGANAPDGTHTATLLTYTPPTAPNAPIDAYILNSVSSPAPYSNTAVTASVWLRVPSGTKTFPLYFLEVSVPGSPLVSVEAQTVTVTTNWQRFSLSGVTQDSLSYLALQIGGSNFIQSGQLEVWGAQMELGSSASPYVPTASQPVSRGANFTNILAYSQHFTPTSWSYSTSAPLPQWNGAVAPDQTQSAATVTSGGADTWVIDWAPNPAMYSGATVTGSVYLRSPSGTRTITLNLISGNPNNDGNHPLPVTLTTTWQRFQITATLPSELTSLGLQVGGGNSFLSGTVEVWGAQMEVASTAGPYVATLATPITAGGEYVNLLPFSQQFTPSWWWYSADSVQVNAASAPDQTQTAAVVTGGTTTTDVWVSNRVPNPALYSGSTVTASVYLRSPGGARTINLNLIREGASGHVSSWTQVSLTQNWQRFPITATLQNGLTFLSLQIGGGNSFSNGSFEIWGTQIVNGTSPGSYDATGGSSGTTLGQPGALVPNGLFEAYAYDSFGNMKQSGNFTFWQNYDANNRLVGYQYDAAGNLLADGISNIMTWDAENRIRSANGTTYVYDAEGNRVSKSSAGMTDTVYFGGRPIARLEAGQWTDLIYGPMGLLAEVPGTQNGSPSYRLLDHLGTQVATADASGALSSVTDSAPFGQIFTGGSSDPYKFTGKERDAESGLDYFGARYYGSTMGRWMSPDWSSAPQPVPYASLGNPQTLNLYAYLVITQ